MIKSVIDVGSNSVLLVVAEKQDGSWRTIEETSAVTGLGKGTKTSGLLSESGMASTLAAIKTAFDRASNLGSDPPIAAATMAARIASNTSDFLARADSQGTPVRVLSGTDEADLGFRAVAKDPLFADADRLSIVDVGGHSTEIVVADRSNMGWNTLFRWSFPLGALGLREDSLEPDSPTPQDILRSVVVIDDKLSGQNWPLPCGQVVTLGATGTNLVTLREKMDEWQPDRVHGAWLGYDEISLSVAWLSAFDDAGRARLKGIEKGREHTIHAGALILERCLFALGSSGCTVSVRGWRHALLESE